MVSTRTLRRKLQKKLKRKPCWGRCPRCGANSVQSRLWSEWDGTPHLYRECKNPLCGFSREQFWSGGGKADAYAPR